MNRSVTACLVVCLAAAAVSTRSAPLPQFSLAAEVRYLKRQGKPSVEYVLSKFRDRRVVIVGEAHRVRHDVELILALIPKLQKAGADALAVEMFPASEQPRIDRLLGSAEWNQSEAMVVLRKAAWPYREYLEILHTAWTVNRALPTEADRFKVIALGPGEDWRERLVPQGKDYESFMAERVLDALKSPKLRLLVYVGSHHSYTRYYQPESPREHRVERFFDRMGNKLRRELGEDVFSIQLHRPFRVRDGQRWTYAPPVAGRIDCAGLELGRAVGFDVVGSPFADLTIDPACWYAFGYSSLRLTDMTDGYVWTKPIGAYEGVGLIPLAEFAPDDAARREVLARNPFSDDKTLGPGDLDGLWRREAEDLQKFVKSSRWEPAADPTKYCPSSPSRRR